MHHFGYGQVFAAVFVVLGSFIVFPIGLGIVRVAGRRVYAALEK